MRELAVSILAVATIGGFSFAEKVFVIDVEGMTCKLCPIAVKKAVEKVRGVKWVSASLKNRVAVVVAEDSVSEKKILEVIQKAGNYRGTIISKGEF